MTPTLVLASTSPARLMLLQQAGIRPRVYPSNFDESTVHCDDPAALVEQLALGKATAVAQALSRDPADAGSSYLVLGCDSVLVIDGAVCGKPGTPETAIARWQQMRGQVGELLTGHALMLVSSQDSPQPAAPKALLRHRKTRVSFANASDRQIEAYVATGEPLQCAGAFTLEGRGGALIERIEGCYSNVIGLSLPLLREMLESLGHDISDFWTGNTE